MSHDKISCKTTMVKKKKAFVSIVSGKVQAKFFSPPILKIMCSWTLIFQNVNF